MILTGATGSGKTTTLAMIVNQLNRGGGCRILTVEEPVEYVFPRMTNSVVTQREVGVDVLNFADGLKYGLRQDPDVILVGEIRDRETAQMALSAAETGHLVFTTLHTRDAKGAVTRFADFFSQEAQHTVRGQLAMSLRAIVSQRLLPGVEHGAKRELAIEVLWNTHPIANAIRIEQDREHRQLHPDRPRGGHGLIRRVVAAIIARGKDHTRCRGAERERCNDAEPLMKAGGVSPPRFVSTLLENQKALSLLHQLTRLFVARCGLAVGAGGHA